MSTLVTMAMKATLTEPARVLSLRMLWVVKTGTSRTFVSGPTTRLHWLNSMACLHQMLKPSPRTLSKEHPELTKTPCLANWPMLFQDVLLICSIFRGPTTQWMQHVPPQWLLSWTLADCCRCGKSTSCWPEPLTEPWTQRPSLNFLQLVLFHPRTPLPLTHVLTDS